MTNFKISKLNFHRESFEKRGKLLGFGTSPQADWKIVFVVSILISLVVIFLSAFIFIKIDKGEIFVVERLELDEGKTVDLEALREAVAYYQEKEREFLRLTNGE